MGPTREDEWTWIRMARSGSEEAVDRLYREFFPTIHAFLLQMDAPPQVAEDLAQETFLRALAALDRYEQRGRLATWLYRIALNTWRNHLRRERRTEYLPEGEVRPGLEPSAEQRALERLQADEMLAMVHRLPEDQRLSVVLRYYHGASTAEIARVCRCPEGTVKSRLHHGLKRLEKQLRERGETGDERAGGSERC